MFPRGGRVAQSGVGTTGHKGPGNYFEDVRNTDFYAMVYRHFAFSNYCPSAPTYPLPLDRNEAGGIGPFFVRVEAFAYPEAHAQGQPFTAAAMRQMNLCDISLLHDQLAEKGPEYFGGPHELRATIPIVDMIFSQPLGRVRI